MTRCPTNGHTAGEARISALRQRVRTNTSSIEDARFAHQTSSIDLGPSSNDLGLARALRLRRARQRLLQRLGEDDVLDQERLDGDAPGGRDLLEDLLDLVRDLLAVGDEIL
jgi:hypothetical protein